MNTTVWLHIGGGLVLLAMGAWLFVAPKRAAAHRVTGELYFWLLALTCGSAMLIGARHPGISVFEAITPVTFGYGLLGYAAGKIRPARWRGRPWVYWHLLGMGVSYIGVVTAFGFQVLPRVLPGTGLLTALIWLVPTLVGGRLLRRAAAKWAPRRPAPAQEATPLS